MKKNIVRLLCFALLFLPKFLFAQQDITGLWKGKLYDDTVKKYIPYEIVISSDNGKLDGYSYAIFKDSTGKEQVGLRSIKIKQKGDKIEIEDEDIVSSTYSVAPAKRVRKHMDLTLGVKDSILIMSGEWSTNWANTNKLHPVTGKITVQKKNDGWRDEPLIKKLDTLQLSKSLSFVQAETRPQYADNYVNNNTPVTTTTTSKNIVASPAVVLPPAADVAERKISTIQTISFQSDSLSLTLYDNGDVDGDTVSIVLGGKVIFSKQGLSTQAATKVISTKGLPDSTTLIWYAENLGRIPPNTGLLILYDGTVRHEVFFSADLQTNAALILRRKKDGE
jgi:hypothetical protein